MTVNQIVEELETKMAIPESDLNRIIAMFKKMRLYIYRRSPSPERTAIIAELDHDDG